MNERWRTVFMGTAGLACASLRALAGDERFEVLGVVTQPDKPKGRDLRIQPSAVKSAAGELGLAVWQPKRVREPQFVEELKACSLDLIVVVAFGQIIPTSLLDLPRFGCVNVHTSLLPKYRGAAPIQWALLNGDRETGVTIMRMDAGLDTGEILAQVTTPIGPGDDASTLHDRLAELGARTLLQTLPEWVEGRITPRAQPAGEFPYARKIEKEDGRLDWGRPAAELWNRVRAFTPWPGAYSFLSVGTKRLMVKIWEADLLEGEGSTAGAVVQADAAGILIQCGTGRLRVRSIQREGGRRMGAAEFLAGCRLEQGQKLE